MQARAQRPHCCEIFVMGAGAGEASYPVKLPCRELPCRELPCKELSCRAGRYGSPAHRALAPFPGPAGLIRRPQPL